MKRTMKWAVLLVILTVLLSIAFGASAEGKKLQPRIRPLAEEPVPKRGGANIAGVKNDGATCVEYTYTVNNGTDTGVVWYEYALCILDDPRPNAYADTLYASDRTKSNEFTYTFYQTGTYVLFVYRYDANGDIVQNDGRDDVQTRIYITQGSGDNPLTQAVARAADVCQRDNEFDTAVAINDYLADHVTYDYSFTYYSPEAALLQARGVCNSYSRAYELIARACGLNCLRVNGDAGEGHAWNAVQINGEWYQVDPTWNDSDSKATRHLYMGLSDAVMGVDHFNFDYPYAEGTAVSCDSLEENYYFHTGIWREMASCGQGNVLGNVQAALDSLDGSSGTITADFGRKAWLEGGDYYVQTADTFKILGPIYAYALSQETLTRNAGGTETPMRGMFTYAFNNQGGTFTGTVAESGLTISGLAESYDTGDPICATVTFDPADYAGAPEGLTLEAGVAYEGYEESYKAMAEYDGEGLVLDIDGWQLWENGNSALEAVVRDENGLVVSRVRKPFTVQASHEWDLSAPAVPAYFTPGTDCEMQLFTGTDAAAHANSVLRVVVTATAGDNYETRYDGEDLPLDETIRFAANPGEKIAVDLTVMEPGYPSFCYNADGIPVLAEMADADHLITLTIEPAGSTQPIYGQIWATVEAEGAEWVALADSNGNITAGAEGDNMTVDLLLGEESRYTVWALAGYADGMTRVSEAQAFELTRAGAILEIDLVTDLPGQTVIERGTPIHASFVEAYGTTGLPEGMEATYEFSISSMNDASADYKWAWTDQDSHALTVQTDGMPAGAYRMSGWVYAPGYMPWYTEEIQFTVKDQAATAPKTVSLTVDRTEATTGEIIGISAYAKGAEMVNILNDGELIEQYRGDYCLAEYSYDRSGAYSLTARAFFTEDPGNGAEETDEYIWDPENGIIQQHFWYLDSAVKTVTVSVEEGRQLVLTDDMITLPEGLEAGEDLEAEIAWPENAAYIDVQVADYPDGYKVYGYMRFDRNDESGESVTYTLDAATLSALEKGDGITIRVTAGAPGYDAAEWLGSVPTTGTGWECAHAESYEKECWIDAEYTEIEGNHRYHSVSGTKATFLYCLRCDECLEQIGEATRYEEIMEDHTYDENGVCTLCGHVNTCTHEHWTQEQWVYVNENEVIHPDDENTTDLGHRVSGDGYAWKVCEDCGVEFDQMDLEGVTMVVKPHEYDQTGYCDACGHQCSHQYTDESRAFDHYEYAVKDRDCHCTVPVIAVTHYCMVCGYRDPEEVPVYEREPEGGIGDHWDEDEDGICDYCGGDMDQQWSWRTEGGHTLIISGNGTVDGFADIARIPWFVAGEADEINQVIIENGITGLGSNLLAGFDRPIRVDFYTDTQPQTEPDTFGTNEVICRYYDNTNVWDTTVGGENVSWIWLPVREGGDSWVVAYYREDGKDTPTWHLRENFGAGSARDIEIDRATAIEYTFRQVSAILNEIPTAESGDRAVLEGRNVPAALVFGIGCQGNYTLDYSRYPDLFVQLDVDAPNLTLTIEGPEGETDPLFCMDVRAGTVICNWDVSDLRLRDSRDRTASTYVDGNVEILSYYDATADDAYTGTLTVTGEVTRGTVYGRNEVNVPGITQKNNPVRFGSISTANFTNQDGDGQAVAAVVTYDAATGESQLNPAIQRAEIGELTLDMFELTYQFWEERVAFGLSPKEGQGIGNQSGYIDDILTEEYNPVFTTADIIWGEDTTVYFMDTGDRAYVLNGGTENGTRTGLGGMYLQNCNVTVNCPVHFMKTWQYRNDLGPVTLTINDRVTSMEVTLFRDGGRIHLGPNGEIISGTWDRGIRGYRSIGTAHGECDYVLDGALTVLSSKSGQQIKAIPASDKEVTAAAGANDGTMAMMDINDSGIGRMTADELDEMDAYLAAHGLDRANVASVFDVSVDRYTVDDEGYAQDRIEEVSKLNRGVMVTVGNSSGEAVTVVRLHEDADGNMEATQLTDSVSGSSVRFTSDSFSTYLLVTGVDELNPDDLTKLILPAGLRRIEANAFEGIAAQAVFIPEGCEYIGSNAFRNCPNLVYVQYYEGTEVESDAFALCNSLEPKEIPRD